MNETAERFMRMAIAEARRGMREGNHPYGSVIVKDGTVLAKAHSTGALTHDIAAHADMSAARKLSRKAKTQDVKGAAVYATGEPCPMCSAALAAMRISELFIGANYRDLPPPMNRGRKRPGKITYKEIFKEYGLNVKVKEGVLKDQVLGMYDEYIKKRPAGRSDSRISSH
ncbi:MAG TPA: nucleoside deaminase [Candidatus Acidoferrales bacterium]|nr:nucleoside deaminase [Candidatus Acidoferrales bacterium]